MFGPQPGGRFVALNAPVSYLIRFAYEPSPWNRDLDAFQMTGGPGWLAADRFDVNAKAAGDVLLSQMRQMVQALLVERFCCASIMKHASCRSIAWFWRAAMAASGRSCGARN